MLCSVVKQAGSGRARNKLTGIVGVDLHGQYKTWTANCGLRTKMKHGLGYKTRIVG